jgi:hypothetical protein
MIHKETMRLTFRCPFRRLTNNSKRSVLQKQAQGKRSCHRPQSKRKILSYHIFQAIKQAQLLAPALLYPSDRPTPAIKRRNTRIQGRTDRAEVWR